MNTPKGWQLVPVEPTDHMRGLGRAMQLGGTATARNIYQTMLAAAPTPSAQEFPWEPCNEGCAEVGKTQHCTCEQAKAFMAAQESHTAIRTLKEGINTVPAHPDIGDTPPAKEAEPVATVYRYDGKAHVGGVLDHLPDGTKLYTRPNDELRKAAEGARQLLSSLLDEDLIMDLPGLRISVTDARDNLRAALEKKK